MTAPTPPIETRRSLRNRRYKQDAAEGFVEQSSQPTSGRKRTRSQAKAEDDDYVAALRESKKEARESGTYVSPTPPHPASERPDDESLEALRALGSGCATKRKVFGTAPDLENNSSTIMTLLATKGSEEIYPVASGSGTLPKEEEPVAKTNIKGSKSVPKVNLKLVAAKRELSPAPTKRTCRAPAVKAKDKGTRTSGTVGNSNNGKKPAVRSAKGKADAMCDRYAALAAPVSTEDKKRKQAQQRMDVRIKAYRTEERKMFALFQRKDYLIRAPVPNHIYATKKGELRLGPGNAPYDIKEDPQHPKLKIALQRKVATLKTRAWYKNMPHSVNIPVAGVPSDKSHKPDLKLNTSTTAEQNPSGNVDIPVAGVPSDKPHEPDFEFISVTPEQNPSDINPSTWDTPLNHSSVHFGSPEFNVHLSNAYTLQEDNFHSRPTIKLTIPDLLKGLLVDDWEAVTKNNTLVPLPHPHPVTKILKDYVAHEKPKRVQGMANLDILDETIAGIKEYFDKCLSRILLYRFERAQYAEFRERMLSGDFVGKTACDVYGAEHLMRLMVSLPELIAQTNMDQQSVNRLKKELSEFCKWLEKEAGEYFLKEYEVPNADYTEKAKN